MTIEFHKNDLITIPDISRIQECTIVDRNFLIKRYGLTNPQRHNTLKENTTYVIIYMYNPNITSGSKEIVLNKPGTNQTWTVWNKGLVLCPTPANKTPRNSHTVKRTNIKIHMYTLGDQVKVTDLGHCYINAKHFATKHNMQDFEPSSNGLDIGDICTVVAIEDLACTGQKLGIYSVPKNKSWVIISHGLKPYSFTPAFFSSSAGKTPPINTDITVCPNCGKEGDHTGMIYYPMDNICKWL